MKYLRLLLAGLVCSVGFFSCAKKSAPSIGSETNWLITCDADSECGNNSCVCGVCTLECDTSIGCIDLESAVCSKRGEAAYLEQCLNRESSPGICLPECSSNDDCAIDQRCEEEACVFTSNSADASTSNATSSDADTSNRTRSDSGISDSSELLLADRDFLLDSAQGYNSVEGTTIRLNFYRDAAGGLGFSIWAECNHMGGSFVLRDGIVEVGGMSSTEIGCRPEFHRQDEWLTDFMVDGPRLELDNDRLTLTGSDATLYFLDREVADPDRPLVGPTWTVDTFISDESMTNYALTVEPYIEFRDDGTLNVFTTCNSGEGVYTINGGNITFSETVYTDEGCPDMSTSTAADHIKAVIADGTGTYEIEAARLTIQRGSKGIGARAEPEYAYEP